LPHFVASILTLYVRRRLHGGILGYVVGRLIDFGLSGISGYYSCGCEDMTADEDSFS